MSGKRSRKRLRRDKGRHSGVSVSMDSDGTARVSVAGLSEREQHEFLAVLADEAAKAGIKAIAGGEEITPDAVVAVGAGVCRVADPPDASIGWPENVAGHDQAAAALLDWLTSLEAFVDDPAGDDGHAWQTVTSITAAMPAHATVSVVLELSEGHLIATLINRNQTPAITVLYYGDDDPERWGDARDAQVVSLITDAH